MGIELGHGVHAGVSVVELRRYAMRPGQRDTLIELFEREFIESQEACGMQVVGHYRDPADPEAFIWFREFADMGSRRGALEAFYDRSPAWLSNCDAANATMVDSDNVLLLRPARENSSFDLRALQRPSANRKQTRFVAASIAMLPAGADDAYLGVFENAVLPALRDVAERVAYFVTEDAPNDFRLPVREGEYAFVVTGWCMTEAQLDAWAHAFGDAAVEHLCLQPASRSLY